MKNNGKYNDPIDRHGHVRPSIAMIMAWTLAFVTVVVLLSHAYSVVFKGAEWDSTLIGIMILLPSQVIQRYFDKRSDDKALNSSLQGNLTYNNSNLK